MTQQQIDQVVSENQILFSLNDVTKKYKQGKNEFSALRALNLNIPKGELLFVTGRSGSGKSTFLNLIAGIDRPTSGTLYFQKQKLTDLSEDQLAQWRGKNVGVVFQFFQLIPSLTIIENILIAMEFTNKIPKETRRTRALELLTKVGIEDQAHKLPATLSGGQQQRAAIARALANDPEILVADEPTGNLDSSTADVVLSIFAELIEEGKTVIIVTHDTNAASQGSRQITLQDGKLVHDTRR